MTSNDIASKIWNTLYPMSNFYRQSYDTQRQWISAIKELQQKGIIKNG